MIILSLLALFKIKKQIYQACFKWIGMTVFLYVFINIAMVTGVLIVVGAPLPLLSYGGTAMLTVFVILEFINLSINRDKEDLEIVDSC